MISPDSGLLFINSSATRVFPFFASFLEEESSTQPDPKVHGDETIDEDALCEAFPGDSEGGLVLAQGSVVVLRVNSVENSTTGVVVPWDFGRFSKWLFAKEVYVVVSRSRRAVDGPPGDLVRAKATTGVEVAMTINRVSSSRIQVHREEFTQNVRVSARPASFPIDGFNIACVIVGILFMGLIMPEVMGFVGKVTSKCVTICIVGRSKPAILGDILRLVTEGDLVLERRDRIILVKQFGFRMTKTLSQISCLKVWGTDPDPDPDPVLSDLLERLRRNEIDGAKHHPLFWTHEEKLNFLSRLGSALLGLRGEFLESHRFAIFGPDWRYSFRSVRERAFIEEEMSRKRLTGETRSLRSLVTFMLRKMRHVCETSQAAGLELDSGQRQDIAVLEFVTSPFPGLFTETYALLD
jgi:hypothetical protein